MLGATMEVWFTAVPKCNAVHGHPWIAMFLDWNEQNVGQARHMIVIVGKEDAAGMVPCTKDVS
jgi:hypothetical protein